LKWTEIDAENSCLRFSDTKEGASIRPVGLPVLDLLDVHRSDQHDVFVFSGTEAGKPLVGFPKIGRSCSRALLLQTLLRMFFAIALPASPTI
jgi:hypothetical protein